MVGMDESIDRDAQGAEPFELSGGALCLDFTNTLGDRPRSESEQLHTYDDLLRFSRESESLSAADLEGLEALSKSCDACSDPIFERAIELREALYRIFSGLTRSESPAERDLEVLNAAINKRLCQIEMRHQGNGFDWAWGGPERALDRPLWPIARSAAELLTSNRIDSIRECDSETCSWLFLDRSRNRRRRWCDMSTCGNRAKARRHYRRQKKR